MPSNSSSFLLTSPNLSRTTAAAAFACSFVPGNRPVRDRHRPSLCPQLPTHTHTHTHTPTADTEMPPRAQKPYSARGVAGLSQMTFKPQGRGQRTKFYGVRRGRDGFVGVLKSWEECQSYVKGVSGAEFKSFKTMSEAHSYISVKSNNNRTKQTTTSGITTTTTQNRGGNGAQNKVSMTSSTTNPNNNNNINYSGRQVLQPSTYHATSNTNPDLHLETRNRLRQINQQLHLHQHKPGSGRPYYPPGPGTGTGSGTGGTGAVGTDTGPGGGGATTNGSHRKTRGSTNGSRTDSGLYAPTNAEELVADSPDSIVEAPLELVVYTDGACSENGSANAKAGYGVYFGPENPYNISARLWDNPTNQRAEMTAVLEAMRVTLAHGLVAKGGTLIIFTDSQFTRTGILQWMHDWKLNEWKKKNGGEVANKEVWMSIDGAYQALRMKGINLKIEWVKGHAGVHGNEMADRLACAGINAV